ncbi:MAG TPA: LuxR C-terminal-related transcriptional regulator [Pseudohaliea sp.]|nr:LuxR C-terminal-related transcriptional regulator [Pseudohaliea sp.]
MSRDGTVDRQNRASRQLLGNCIGQRCCDAMAALRADGALPCHEACAGRLLKAGLESPAAASIRREGRQHLLACVPVGDNVICSITPGGSARPPAWQSLTARELSVLELLAAGETTSSAAIQLGLSTSTVRTHVEKLRLKLGASTQAAVVARGYQLGYLY